MAHDSSPTPPLTNSMSADAAAAGLTLDQEVDQFRDKIKSQAEQLVLKKFPRYMLDLDIMLQVTMIAIRS